MKPNNEVCMVVLLGLVLGACLCFMFLVLIVLVYILVLIFVAVSDMNVS